MAEDADMRNELEEMQRRADQLADEVRPRAKQEPWGWVWVTGMARDRSWSGRGVLGLILFSVILTRKAELEKKWNNSASCLVQIK